MFVAPKKFEEKSEEKLSNSINVAGKNIGSSSLQTTIHFASLTLAYLALIHA